MGSIIEKFKLFVCKLFGLCTCAAEDREYKYDSRFGKFFCKRCGGTLSRIRCREIDRKGKK